MINGSQATPIKTRVWHMTYRGLVACEQMLQKLNWIISAVYKTMITLLYLLVLFAYVSKLRLLVHESFPIAVSVIHAIISVYFLLTICINFIACLYLRPSQPPAATLDIEAPTNELLQQSSSSSPSSTSPYTTRSETWRLCTQCNAPKPPRTHHCTTCKTCYMKLCHHCPALGRCIAQDNYPYFYRFVTSVAMGSAFTVATCNALLNKGVEGDENIVFLFVVGGVPVAVATGLLALWHVYLVATGQTTIEWLDNWRARRRGDAPASWGWFGGPFSTSLRGNVGESFGRIPLALFPWWLVLFLPVPRFAPR